MYFESTPLIFYNLDKLITLVHPAIIERAKYTINASEDNMNAILVITFLLSFFIDFLDKINAGTINTYENIICLKINGIDIISSIIDIIEINFIFSLLILITFDIFIVIINKITPINPGISP